ncbi:threonine synthase [Tamaricihabitans halophyticus]|uniref:Threonine synthase n=1 Tax=Tamaricihabitans halophyticus TaxID=1262583 RepID=A0A4R2Q9Z9_9PSEU|nr:threonine synthase [Tamaricihabitans halophyticus]TCP45722.1 threonine synthase [Tamaricihabitans halophyticus]
MDHRDRPEGLAHCVLCDRPQRTEFPDYCAGCGGPVVLPPAPVALPATTESTGAWRYAGRLPISQETAWLSMGEGQTPLVSATSTRAWCATERLRYKLDHLNPSGSFKDRATAVGIAQAITQGAPAVVCASSGNAAGSTAAYAARAGLPSVVLVPEAVPPGKAAVAQAHGATVLRVRGDYSNSFQVARELAARLGWLNLTTTFVNPVAVSGLRSAGYELAEQLSEVPDWIVVPIGSGPLVHGIVTAYQELRAAGMHTELPRILGVQAHGCAPIVDAFDRDVERVTPWPTVSTRISAISDPLRGYPSDGTYTLRLVRETRGAMVAVRDAEAEEAAEALARDEGLLIESGAAANLAAVRTARDRGWIHQDELVVCMLTGHGIKTLAAAGRQEAPLVANTDDVIGQLPAHTTKAPEDLNDRVKR